MDKETKTGADKGEGGGAAGPRIRIARLLLTKPLTKTLKGGDPTIPALIFPCYCWEFAGEPRRTRTYNPLIKSQLLCQLS